MTALPSDVLRLHGWCTSPFCQKTLLALQHKGLTFEWVAAPFMTRGKLVEATGSNQVPVLEAGHRFISDSTAIAAFLDQEKPTPPLYPTEARLRGQARLVEDWADETLCLHAHAAYWCPQGNARRLLLNAVIERPTLETRLGAWIFERAGPRMFRKLATLRRPVSGSRALLGQQLDMVEGLLQGAAWLVGEEPSMADFAVAGQLVNLLDLEEERYFASRPTLGRWLGALAATLPERCRVARAAEPRLVARSA